MAEMKPVEGTRREDNGPLQSGKFLNGMKHLHEEKYGTQNTEPRERLG
jgi:hypothetical protein